MAAHSTRAPLRAYQCCRDICTRTGRQQRRTMATEAPLSQLVTPIRETPSFALSTTPREAATSYTSPSAVLIPGATSPLTIHPKVTTTLHSFPTLEPMAHLEYPSSHLYLPMRKDLLHRAVIFEGDMTRQGTANTKWRSEVHGSNKKIRPQKGTGRARLGDKKSPMLRGGGVAFGPKPRDFATGLPRKVYDLAWRTALSARYRRGELVVVDNLNFDTLEMMADALQEDNVTREHRYPYYLRYLFRQLQWGRTQGRSMLITMAAREETDKYFYRYMGQLEALGQVRSTRNVDVKNVLMLGRVVIEKDALDHLLVNHQSDLGPLAKNATFAWNKQKELEIRASIMAQDSALEKEAVDAEVRKMMGLDSSPAVLEELAEEEDHVYEGEEVDRDEDWVPTDEIERRLNERVR